MENKLQDKLKLLHEELVHDIQQEEVDVNELKKI